MSMAGDLDRDALGEIDRVKVGLPDDASLARVARDHVDHRIDQAGAVEYATFLRRLGLVLLANVDASHGRRIEAAMADVSTAMAAAAIEAPVWTEAERQAARTRTELEAAETHFSEWSEADTASASRRAFLSMHRRLKSKVYWPLLTAVIAGETAFNMVAFRITREPEHFVVLMALMLGLTSLVSAHLAGMTLEELLHRRPPAVGVSRADTWARRLRALVAVFMFAAMLAALGGAVDMRDAYLNRSAGQPVADVDATDDAPERPRADVSVALAAVAVAAWLVAVAAAFAHASVGQEEVERLSEAGIAARTRQDLMRAETFNASAALARMYEAAWRAHREAIAELEVVVEYTNSRIDLYMSCLLTESEPEQRAGFLSKDVPRLVDPDVSFLEDRARSCAAAAEELRQSLDGYIDAALTQGREGGTE